MMMLLCSSLAFYAYIDVYLRYHVHSFFEIQRLTVLLGFDILDRRDLRAIEAVNPALAAEIRAYPPV
jgi:hypothetical protein